MITNCPRCGKMVDLNPIANHVCEEESIPLYKIRDGLGTTRVYQNATSPDEALTKYAVSVGVPSTRLKEAGWIAIRS